MVAAFVRLGEGNAVIAEFLRDVGNALPLWGAASISRSKPAVNDSVVYHELALQALFDLFQIMAVGRA